MRAWPDSLKGLQNPPVVEIALAVQFATIPGLTPAHYGVFWKEYLGSSWVKPRATVPLEESFETFDQSWASPQLLFGSVEVPASRLQFFNQNDDRVLQLQNNKLAYNWRKSATSYPTFDQTCKELIEVFNNFKAFIRANGLEEVLPNQWELTYIDHVPKGSLWQGPTDFHKVFPGLFPENLESEGNLLESQSVQRRYAIEPNLGRVYLSAVHALIGPNREAIVLTSAARGSLTRDGSIEAGLRLGHEAIGRAFVAVSSDAAITFWKEF